MLRSLFDRLKDARFKRSLIRSKKVYNKTRNSGKALAVLKGFPNSYITRVNLSGRLIRNRNNLVNHMNALSLNNFRRATVIPIF